MVSTTASYSVAGSTRLWSECGARWRAGASPSPCAQQHEKRRRAAKAWAKCPERDRRIAGAPISFVWLYPPPPTMAAEIWRYGEPDAEFRRDQRAPQHPCAPAGHPAALG